MFHQQKSGSGTEWKQLYGKKTHSNGINDFYLFWKGNPNNLKFDDDVEKLPETISLRQLVSD